MSKIEVSQTLLTAAHLLTAASNLVLLDDVVQPQAKQLIEQAQGLVGMARDLAGAGVYE